MPSVSGLLPWLEGVWAFQRSIDSGASIVGTAVFIGRDNGRFDYAEHGQLTLANGDRLDAERRYIFKKGAEGFTVLFAETPPRLFHCIALVRHGANLVGAATHLCAHDRYDSRYEFHPDGSFIVKHRVRGPRKRYVITTQYSREAAT
jgi:hypothetical protein